MKYINSSKLDERIVRSDLDHGYREGRQFGRGRSGGQVRDEYRQEFDAGRGGWGHLRARQEAERERDQKANYEAITTIPEGANLDYKDRKEGKWRAGYRGRRMERKAYPTIFISTSLTDTIILLWTNRNIQAIKRR